jgi:hypothetical protein
MMVMMMFMTVLSKLLGPLMVMMMSMTFATLTARGCVMIVMRVASFLVGKLTDMSVMPMTFRGKFTCPFGMPAAFRMLCMMVLGKMPPCVESIAARVFVVSL